MRSLLPLSNLQLDFRTAWRQVFSNPKHALIAILTVSLCIGITVAAFTVIYAELVRPLPYDAPDRIVLLRGFDANENFLVQSYLHYADVQGRASSFKAVGGYTTAAANVAVSDQVARVNTVYTTSNFFDVFAVRPMLGRVFVAGENAPGNTLVAVLGHEVWERDFRGAKDVVGQKISVNGVMHTVIGVMPNDFRYPLGLHNTVYLPLKIDPKLQARGSHWLRTIGRLREPVSPHQAQAELDQLCQQIGRENPADSGYHLRVVPLKEWVSQASEVPLKALCTAALFVFFIGCINVAGLQLSRGIKRERELALRIVLGASSKSIFQLVFLESFILSIIGMAGGVIVSWSLLSMMHSFLTESLSRAGDLRIDTSSLVIAATCAVGTTILVGMLPALRLSKTNPNAVLKDSGNSSSSRRYKRLRGLVILTQMAVAFVLLTFAGILVQVVLRWRATDIGFSPDHTMTVELNLPSGKYDERNIVAEFFNPMLEQVENLPGVTSAGVIQVLPIQDWGWSSGVQVVGAPPDPPNAQRMAEDRYVSPGIYAALGLSLIKGRMFDPKIDTPQSQPVCIVNEAFAKQFFFGGDPIGRSILSTGTPTRIIGVVSSLRQDLFEPPMPEEDFPISQLPAKLASTGLLKMHLVARVNKPSSVIVPGLRRVLHEIDPSVPIESPSTMNDVIDDVLTFQRMEGWLFSVFAGLAVFLAAIGLYGIVSYEVESSTRDIGIRMAVGATRAIILKGTLQRISLLVGSGILLGGMALWLCAKAIQNIVTIRTAEPANLTLILQVAVFLLLVGLASAFLPAQRAASVQPVEALRTDT